MRARIGMIGLGDIARKVYLPLLTANTAVDLVGVMSTTGSTVEHAVQQYRLPYGTTSVTELLALGLDAVFIHSPTPTHYELAKACLERGIAVYVDKPISYHLRESEELAAMAEKKGLLLGVGFNRRFAPRYVDALQWMEQHGGLEWAVLQKHRTKQQQLSAQETVYDDLIHMLDLLVWLGGGEPFQLQSSRLLVDERGRMLRASGAVSMGNAEAAYSMVRHAGIDLERIELHGHGASFEVTNMEQAVRYQAGGGAEQLHFGSWDTVLKRRGFEDCVQHFVTHIHQPENCTIRADLLLASHRLAEQVSL